MCIVEVSGFVSGVWIHFCAVTFVEIFDCTAVGTESSIDSQRTDALLLNCVCLCCWQLSKKHRNGHLPKVDWLDRLTFREIEIINERLKQHSNFLYLMIEFPSFQCNNTEYSVFYFEKVTFMLLLGCIAVLCRCNLLTETECGLLVGLSICLSVCLSQSWVLKKTVEPFKMPFGLWTWFGPRNHVLDGVQILPCEGAWKVYFCCPMLLAFVVPFNHQVLWYNHKHILLMVDSCSLNGIGRTAKLLYVKPRSCWVRWVTALRVYCFDNVTSHLGQLSLQPPAGGKWVPAKRQWQCSLAVHVTTGLALCWHWPVASTYFNGHGQCNASQTQSPEERRWAPCFYSFMEYGTHYIGMLLIVSSNVGISLRLSGSSIHSMSVF